MTKFKKGAGPNPEFIKKIKAQIAEYAAKHKGEGMGKDNLVQIIVERISGRPVNLDDHADMVAMVKKQIAKVQSGEIDVSKFMKQ